MNINFEAPINSVSFGFCSYNILLQLYKRGISPCLFNISDQGDLSSFDRAEEDFKFYLSSCASKAHKYFSRENPGFKLWHIKGSETSISKETSLLTFYELDSPTESEVNILKNQKKVFVTSKESQSTFEDYGLQNVVYCPLGFDSVHFRKLNRPYPNDRITFSIFGKLENRKHHAKTIRAWLNKYGDDMRYRLHLHTFNPHISPEDNNRLLTQILGGKRWTNIKPYPYVRTLSELNDCMNATNIVIDMSGAEGFSLPSFHCLGLGKHGVIHNCSAMKDWANEDNAVLVQPSGKQEAYDGMFFHKGQPFNQGNIYTFKDEDFLNACDQAIERFRRNPVNEAGLEIPKKFTWENTADIILNSL